MKKQILLAVIMTVVAYTSLEALTTTTVNRLSAILKKYSENDAYESLNCRQETKHDHNECKARQAEAILIALALERASAEDITAYEAAKENQRLYHTCKKDVLSSRWLWFTSRISLQDTSFSTCERHVKEMEAYSGARLSKTFPAQELMGKLNLNQI